MESTQPEPDRNDSLNPTSSPPTDAVEDSISIGNLKEQSLSSKDEHTGPNDLAHDSNAMDPSTDAPLVSVSSTGALGPSYTPNIFAPQAQTFVYGGYENTSGEWEEYRHHFMHPEAMEAVSTGIYNDNQSVLFHTGYGFNPQMPYGPYSPVTTPLPAAGDGQLYSPQHLSFTGPYYQQPAAANMPYLHAPTPVSQADFSMPIDHQDWLRSSDCTGSTSLPSPAASPQPIGAVGSLSQGIMPLSSGMASQQQRPFYGLGSSINSYDQGYFHGGIYNHGSNLGGLISSFGNNGRGLFPNDKGRRRGKGNATSTWNTSNDFLNEQNRGPRATRLKNADVEQGLSNETRNSNVTPIVNSEQFNRPDFPVEYGDAKFFIIKSYSEDNVHKSIKYGIWASTANGNKKLDAAFREAKEKGDSCSVFLFFSVNASAHFCGVAEMVGPVDFNKSVDYWQQDKWTGQFPVKWHIIKDVPNSLFRHIILENNDNKPVTNSRDTQEVKLEHGLEMLSILKNHDSNVSILDDFEFYEDRQKAMQERKTRQQQQQQQQQQVSLAKIPDAAISQMSKNFAQVVKLEKANGEDTTSDKTTAVVVNSENPKQSSSSTSALE
ncbi:hypothetical protein HPP92_000246 [Vanilla planifolia]|uniref:YTH domain-containing family protein n=1 Tax=Vanilla planifolia TaxID=51239 RepID=A0A835RW15_VANPL|nr:hypothetical protein HPP92_000246 [Vanilla planifolia]